MKFENQCNIHAFYPRVLPFPIDAFIFVLDGLADKSPNLFPEQRNGFKVSFLNTRIVMCPVFKFYELINLFAFFLDGFVKSLHHMRRHTTEYSQLFQSRK